jgi:hypothetical protein
MASTIDAASRPAAPGRDSEVPLWRLYLLRAAGVVFIVRGILYILPDVIFPDPTGRGMITAMLAGLWVLVLFAIRYPLQLLPILLFEFVWKTIWLLAFGLPQWLSGVGSPRLGQDLVDIGLGPLVFGLLIPWGYVWRHYVKKPSERWR